MLQFKPVFRCDEAIKRKFSQSRCLLTISVGQETHENERFSSALDLIGRTFASCTIALHDSLQRHTMALSDIGNADCFHAHAVAIGDVWLRKNEQYITALKIPVTIVRWDEWLNDASFIRFKNEVLLELSQSESYRLAFSSTIHHYLTRYCRRLEHPDLFDMHRAEQLCMNYLIEECAGMRYWPKTGCQFEAYTGKHNAAMIETQKRFLSGEQLRSVAVGFNNRPNLKPQNFGFQKNEKSSMRVLSTE